MSWGEFPRPIKIGRCAVAWPKSSIVEWIEARKAEAGIGVEKWPARHRRHPPATPWRDLR
ncbi:MAG: AlpA family phage regulatory protein [Alphaproteobacteria bacterium]|nr:AlpA family phage regulatory protein [Alphaproteobacteria bacterium]